VCRAIDITDISLDEFLRRRAKLVRVTEQVNEKILRGFFQTLYWRRAFLARRSSTQSSSFAGVGKHHMQTYLIAVPTIVVEESNTSTPRPALPSLDMTHMRYGMGAGYSPTSSNFDGQERLQAHPVQQSDTEDESRSSARTWASIGGPQSNIASPAVDSELYIHSTFVI
jgi:hypothetical protein